MLRVMTDAGWPCTRHLDGSVLHVEVDPEAIRVFDGFHLHREPEQL
jgi:hypothetical protein